MCRLLLLFFPLVFIHTPASLRAQNVQKTVLFTVTDAATGKSVEGAEVRFKTLQVGFRISNLGFRIGRTCL
jgi:hypothetical protein